MRLIFVNRFYWPETPATGQLLTDLAESLAASGHDVSVITSGPASPRREWRHGVRILRVRGTRLGRLGLVGKALDFTTFYLAAMAQLAIRAREDAVIVAMTDPPLLGIGAWLMARLRGARIVHWIQDIYPELAIELGGLRFLAALKPARDAAWREAEACVTLADEMASVVTAAGLARADVTVIPNWAPAGCATAPAEATTLLRREWNLEGKFIIAYSGNLGRVHDLMPVLAVADLLREEGAIAFVFIGGGAQREALVAESKRRGLDNVMFQAAQPRGRLAATLALGDLHLVTLRPGCEQLVFPSKLYGIAAAGRPTLFIGPPQCEVARIVREHNLGRAVGRDDPEAIAGVIRELAARPDERARLAASARRFAVESGFDAMATRWHAVLAAVEACPPRSRGGRFFPAP